MEQLNKVIDTVSKTVTVIILLMFLSITFFDKEILITKDLVQFGSHIAQVYQ